MVCARISEKVLLHPTIAAAISKRTPKKDVFHPVPTKSLLSVELVVVGNRLRPYKRFLDDDRLRLLQPRSISPRLPYSPSSEMSSRISRLDLVLRASNQLKRPSKLPLPTQCHSVNNRSPYWDVNTNMTKSVVVFQSSVSSVNQIQASPSVSTPESQPEGPPDPSKPSPTQLSFILDKLREEVRSQPTT